MAPSLDLISIGDSTKDVFLKIREARVSCALNTDACMLCLNYADKIPVESVTQVAAAGNAANAAVGTCRLNHHCALVTVLGDDHDGHHLYDELGCERINRSYVTFDQEHGTNYSAVLSFKGERTILVYHEPRTYAFPKSLPGAKWVYYTSMGPGHQAYEKSLIQYLNKHPKTRMLFNPGTHQLRRGLKSLMGIMKKTDIFIINKDEAALLLEEKEDHPIQSMLTRLHAKVGAAIVLTDGPNGSYAHHAGHTWFIPIFPGKAKERTGAGDAYATGFVNALIAGHEIPEAMRWGNANSWSVVRQIGPQAGLLDLRGMKEVLSRFKGVKAREM